jgi:hypothetical protein
LAMPTDRSSHVRSAFSVVTGNGGKVEPELQR